MFFSLIIEVGEKGEVEYKSCIIDDKRKLLEILADVDILNRYTKYGTFRGDSVRYVFSGIGEALYKELKIRIKNKPRVITEF